MPVKIKKLHISPAPHLKNKLTLDQMMWWTVAALIFPAIAGVYFFGLKALWLLVTCVLSSVLFEIAGMYLRGIEISLRDGSAVVTGIILALILPASFPLWAAVIGAFFSICIVKHIFGGLGKNIFNPALMGRAFLTAAFPVLITTYSLNYRHISIMHKDIEIKKIEAVSGATPLSRIKFEHAKIHKSSYLNLFLGEKKGSMGETSALLILAGLAVLMITKVADWRLPLSYFITVFALSTLLWLINPMKYINPILTFLLGGILLGGTYMITDPVTTPVTVKGKWLFGAGAGILTVIIRTYSGYPEGVMFSIILMNAVTPLINRYTRSRIYGT